MKVSLMALVAGVGLITAGAAGAAATQDQAMALIKDKKLDCLGCHTIDKKLVGPAWKDVGAKYRGQAGAKAKLVEKVKKGGTGNWGNVQMNPHPTASDADLGTLVDFILTLK
jgi:cytochrome c